MEAVGKFIVGWVIVCNGMSLSARSCLGCEGEEVCDEVLVPLDVLGGEARAAVHEDRRDLAGDDQVCVMGRVVVVQSGSPMKPADRGGAVAEGEYARETSVGGDLGLELNLEEDVDRHSEKFEKVVDLSVPVKDAVGRNTNAPGTAAGVPSADPVGA